MKKILLLICCCFQLAFAFSQPGSYWQQQVNYNIYVSLNDNENTLDGHVKMQYYNNSPDTLYFIWFHVWPNAYKNDKTAFSDQDLENGSTDFYFSNNDRRGYMNRLDFKVAGITSHIEDHPQHQDIIKLVLPQPLSPKSSVNIETPFHVKLPYNFSRGGHVKLSYQVTQWYPKPAVYDRKGWHEIPYLDQGEFYSEFGNYDVTISLPKNYIVAATGILNEERKDTATKSLRYTQDNVHDFAWFADKDFIVSHDTIQLASGIVDVYNYYNKANTKNWEHSIAYTKSAIRSKSNWIGEYPYKIVSVVESPLGGGGMEYPTITLISTASGKALDFLINHEVGHNWFYGILASNERQHPWMDEGMNTYYDNRYSMHYYNNVDPGIINSKSSFINNRAPADPAHIALLTMTSIKKDQPIETPSEKFTIINYNLIAYTKTGEWMKLLEQKLGQPVFDNVMHEYYRRWQFKHPYPEDFKAVAEEVSGKNLDSVFNLLNKKGSLQKPLKKDIRLAAFLSFKDTDKHNYIFISPAIGYNYYDKFMAGLIIHNYTLPPARLKYFLVPLYATNSKQVNGIGNINFTLYPSGKISKVVAGITGARFSTRQSIDTFGNKIFENFYKLVPSLQVHFKYAPRKTTSGWIDFRTYLVGEQGFSNYGLIAGGDSSIYYPNKTVSSNRYINQLSLNIENFRILYPYTFQLQLQQGKSFYRINLNANYFFNYSAGGGMNVRLFAAKFGYIGNDKFDAYQYQPKLLAVTGTEDYTYSNYFIGRSSFPGLDRPVKNEGIGLQQVMIRDGGLKLRLDQFDYLQGRSEEWVAALNLNTTLPDMFPIKIPLKIFFDAGTYAEAWKKDASNPRFLYVGGLQLSLFRNLVNIYAPLIYSKEFRDVLKSTPDRNKFFKRLTFSIDVQNFRLKKFFPQSPF